MNTGSADGTGQQQPEIAEATLPVIAVFGGADDEIALEAAEQIGYQIGLTQAILLTGGDDASAGDLKARVLAGALRARASGAMAPWIGVVRNNPTHVADGCSLVLTPGGNHRRNYVEADLCDAAIAFEGGAGTSSEVVFCIALGKPLILIGDYWLSKYPVVSGDVARDMLKIEAQRRVPLPRFDEHQRLDPFIRKAYMIFDQVVSPSFQVYPLLPEIAARAVVEAALIYGTEASSRPVKPAASLSDDERLAIRKLHCVIQSRSAAGGG